MTDLAHGATEKAPPIEGLEQICPGPLLLPNSSASPMTVYIVYAKAVPNEKGKLIPVFALQATASKWYTNGVKWQFLPGQAEYGLFVNFVLVSGIAGLKVQPDSTPFWVSSRWFPVVGGKATQLSCAPVVSGACMEYHFDVELPVGTTGTLDEDVDPIIVVTPINNTDESG